MNKIAFVALGFGLTALGGACGGESGSNGLAVDVSFAPGIPRATRDESVRVEVYLLDSCDSVKTGDRPDQAIETTFVLRDGTEGPLIAIPDPGEYGLYAVAQDSDCGVVGAACRTVAIESGQQETLSIELGAFAGEGCSVAQQCSLETGDCTGPADDCVDLDEDGLGDGTLGNAGCVNTTTDSNDADGMVCADTDGDTCDDCSNGVFDPLDDGDDSDEDGMCDAGDDCVDVDGDGLGDGTLGNTSCSSTVTDSNDGNAATCADTDGDGCDDCALGPFDPSSDGTDGDSDGICAVSDCDDAKPLCASVCTDVDDDGYCIDTDCDDAVSACDTDCASNTDGDSHVDCFETFCGSDPASGSSVCREATNELEYENAIDAANASPGHDYIVLGDFTVTSDPPDLTDDAGATIRQVAGAALTVSSGGDRLVFKLDSNNNVVDGVHVVNVSNARDVFEVKGDDNIVQNCFIEGFERRGIYVDGGDNAQLLHNIITGGTEDQGSEKAAIILRSSTGSVVSGNTLTLNTMDGLQVRQAIDPVIDHNTIADNGGSGLEFYGESSSNVCLRNNNVTGNGEFGYNGAKVVTFDVSASCIGPLSSGPAYGNNDFDNAGGSCGGNECVACACLPGGSFWTYSVDPLYRSTTAGDLDFFCMDPSASLVDGADDLLTYDLNGEAPGNFNGSNPDVGAREDGPGDCN